MNDPVIGIDLGTTNSLVAVYTQRGPEVLRDKEGYALHPSVVCFKDDGTVALGRAARELAHKHPETTVHSVKRLMGKSAQELRDVLKRLPYEVIDRNGMAVIRIRSREYTPQELSAEILRAVKHTACTALGCEVRRAVVTVPAYFDDAQRIATRDAARIAGLEVIRIVNEPTAAALAYGLDLKKEGVVAVYDLGGGTFDVTVLSIQQGVFKVLATGGDTDLGGDDFDQLLVEQLTASIQAEYGIDLRGDAHAKQALRAAAEHAKIRLTDYPEAKLEYYDAARNIHCEAALSRAQFEGLARGLIERTMNIFRGVLRDAALQPSDIQEVVMVGGMSRMPLVRESVRQLTGKRPHTELNPDEVVALGAAVQAHVLTGGTREILLLDVTPLSLGMETMGGAFTKLINRNTSIPCSVTEEFSTYQDNQSAVAIHILQGERELAKDCRSLGRLVLRGFPPMPAGLPRVAVTFALDSNGVLTVSAREQRSEVEASVEVVPSHGLTRDQVDGIIRNSIDHAQQDFDARGLIEMRNKALGILNALERSREKLIRLATPAELAEVLECAAAVRRLCDGDDHAALAQAVDRLGLLTAPLSERLMDDVLAEKFKGKTVADAFGDDLKI